MLAFIQQHYLYKTFWYREFSHYFCYFYFYFFLYYTPISAFMQLYIIALVFLFEIIKQFNYCLGFYSIPNGNVYVYEALISLHPLQRLPCCC